MGTSRTFGELEGKLNRLAREYGDLPGVVVPESALLVKRAVLALAPAKLSGVGKKGAKLDVRYNETKNAAGAQALVFARGPWQLIEADTRSHRIPKARGSRARRRYAVVPGGSEGGTHGRGGVRSSVKHPGTQGKHPWQKGVEAARPAVNRLFAAQGSLPLRRIF